ncbi:Hsp20/alpha crystallin family protein [Streptomyces sp. NPDC012461]|jgi:HSP20 family protein|uniref:Hsp20/alpha crystallin family protein n=3 Tax=Streptomyces TaxID=1883 RepID=A0A6G3QNM8_9ACTN|nr:MULTISPECIES: Hsp20/alpha crystallin family protein [unclassified Streptomyces]MBM7087922.1 Hsp20/alpha crystallin family protein [Streptomyces sp. S12]MBD9731036.1 Hsp20/alpha crystallin family protein [Streptomyces sp. H28]NEA84834.1 Hsp20/alpha crystallin family protein [Streptomyces sp. SID14436]NEC83649.1 Hsp20/alpha crystallin family protein [Streptomyces sp. SID7958]NED16981.1 Hsp20/alpha crystallin family protein [Streptomyces sp. SID9913]
MGMATPVRHHRGAATQARPLGWARNPLTEFDQLLSEMSGLIESTVGGAATAVAWTPLADVTESDDAFHVEIELPGVKSKDIDVEASGQELVVTGEIKEKERKGVLRRSTRRTGAFEYRLRLPREVDTEKINARMSDGVLTITVPKAEVAKPRHVEITETNDSTGSNG